MAFGEAFQGEPGPGEGTMTPNRLEGVIGAGRVKAAAATRCHQVKHRGNRVPVEHEESHEDPLGRLVQQTADGLDTVHVCGCTDFVRKVWNVCSSFR
jgi:hypothetical protein